MGDCIMKKGQRNTRAARELRGTFWGVAAMLVAYVSFVCIVKDHGSAMVWVAVIATLVGGGALEIFTRFAKE